MKDSNCNHEPWLETAPEIVRQDTAGDKGILCPTCRAEPRRQRPAAKRVKPQPAVDPRQLSFPFADPANAAMSHADASDLDRLVTLTRELDGDEMAVLVLVAERLVNGGERYGTLHVATDPRCFSREALEEAADGLVYVACGLMRHGRIR